MAVAVGRGVDVGLGTVAVGGGFEVLVEVVVGSGVAVGAADNPAHARLIAVNRVIKNKVQERLIFMVFSFLYSFGFVYESMRDAEK
jgi:hypothetical protein